MSPAGGDVEDDRRLLRRATPEEIDSTTDCRGSLCLTCRRATWCERERVEQVPHLDAVVEIRPVHGEPLRLDLPVRSLCGVGVSASASGNRVQVDPDGPPVRQLDSEDLPRNVRAHCPSQAGGHLTAEVLIPRPQEHELVLARQVEDPAHPCLSISPVVSMRPGRAPAGVSSASNNVHVWRLYRRRRIEPELGSLDRDGWHSCRLRLSHSFTRASRQEQRRDPSLRRRDGTVAMLVSCEASGFERLHWATHGLRLQAHHDGGEQLGRTQPYSSPWSRSRIDSSPRPSSKATTNAYGETIEDRHRACTTDERLHRDCVDPPAYDCFRTSSSMDLLT